MKIIRLLLYPFSLIYGLITGIRNWLYNSSVLKSYKIPGTSITVGNISVGGTGKSPMVDYLIELLNNHKVKVSTLSRGYGRVTKGLLEVKKTSTALEVGDEPLMYKQKYGDLIQGYVCEDRKTAIDHIRNKADDCILLDDAFQHRKVKAGLQIVLSTFNAPFFNDHLLPAGNLRESRKGVRRADILIFTKAPKTLEESVKRRYIERSGFPPEKVFFSVIGYDTLKPLSDKASVHLKQILLITGIANPVPLVEELSKSKQVELLRFPDHHNYTSADLIKIREKFDTFEAFEKGIVTTEKDLMRLKEIPEFLEDIENWYVQPIKIKIDRERDLNDLITEYACKN